MKSFPTKILAILLLIVCQVAWGNENTVFLRSTNSVRHDVHVIEIERNAVDIIYETGQFHLLMAGRSKNQIKDSDEVNGLSVSVKNDVVTAVYGKIGKSNRLLSGKLSSIIETRLAIYEALLGKDYVDRALAHLIKRSEIKSAQIRNELEKKGLIPKITNQNNVNKQKDNIKDVAPSSLGKSNLKDKNRQAKAKNNNGKNSDKEKSKSENKENNPSLKTPDNAATALGAMNGESINKANSTPDTKAQEKIESKKEEDKNNQENKTDEEKKENEEKNEEKDQNKNKPGENNPKDKDGQKPSDAKVDQSGEAQEKNSEKKQDAKINPSELPLTEEVGTQGENDFSSSLRKFNLIVRFGSKKVKSHTTQEIEIDTNTSFTTMSAQIMILAKKDPPTWKFYKELDYLFDLTIGKVRKDDGYSVPLYKSVRSQVTYSFFNHLIAPGVGIFYDENYFAYLKEPGAGLSLLNIPGVYFGPALQLQKTIGKHYLFLNYISGNELLASKAVGDVKLKAHKTMIELLYCYHKYGISIQQLKTSLSGTKDTQSMTVDETSTTLNLLYKF